MSEWDKYGKCPCGFHTKAPFGDLFHVHIKVCPECGEDKSQWDVVTARRVSTRNFWKISTWGAEHWEYK